MSERNGENARDLWLAAGLSLVAAVAFSFSIKPTQQHFDYTTRIASALLHGHAGLREQPPSWLNEMVPRDGNYYSVFPLGAVLSVMPIALLQRVALVKNFPGGALATVLVGLSTYFFFRLSIAEGKSLGRRLLLALFPIFGTWTWCNLGFGGAWQIALGFALLGEVAALYFTLVRPRPFVAGLFFALAFGNRTEVVLTLPIYLWFFLRQTNGGESMPGGVWRMFRENTPQLIRFLIAPAALALLTAAYNYARFQSIFDFGYTHIPNLSEEPWYRHGLFSLHAIPWNMYKLLFEGLEDIPNFPYLRPHSFGCSIFLISPFLFLLFREGGSYKRVAWIAIAVLTFALWCHGNPGGWQFSYRYAIILLPWMFLLLVGNGPAKTSLIEISLFIVSVALNAIGTYYFLWTNELHP